jgi:hypothetical protein
MPIYQGNQKINAEYVDSYQLSNVYTGATKVQGNLTVLPIPSQSALIFNVDANLTSSYPGSGSIWYNTATSGASTNLLFTGSFTYSTGSFGNTKYFQLNTASYWSTDNITSTTTNRTLCAWVWVDTIGGDWLNYGQGQIGTDTGISRIGVDTNTATFAPSNFAEGWVSSPITTGSWYNIIGVGVELGANDIASIYVNGVLRQTTNTATLITRTNRAVYGGGNGRVGMMSIYNESFNAATAATYFNNTKELFGY